MDDYSFFDNYIQTALTFLAVIVQSSFCYVHFVDLNQDICHGSIDRAALCGSHPLQSNVFKYTARNMLHYIEWGA